MAIKSEVLTNTHNDNTSLTSQLKNMSTYSGNKERECSDLSSTIKQKEQDLLLWTVRCKELEKSYQDLDISKTELENKLMLKLKSTEEKANLLHTSHMQKNKDLEYKVQQSEEKYVNSTKEMQQLKDKLNEIQAKTEHVIHQKDLVISNLNSNNKQLQSLIQESSASKSDLENNYNSNVMQINELRSTILHKDKELLQKSEQFLQQLEQRANEVKIMEKQHKTAMEKQKHYYEGNILDKISSTNVILSFYYI